MNSRFLVILFPTYRTNLRNCFQRKLFHLHLFSLRVISYICRPPNTSSRLHDSILVSPEDQENFEEFCELAAEVSSSVEGLSYLRAPLQLALMISPLFLLFSFQLAKKSFNRQTLFNLAIQLGNEKPDLLLEVEKSIWNAVFALAGGTSTPLQALKSVLADIPWEKIESAEGPAICGWFDLTIGTVTHPF